MQLCQRAGKKDGVLIGVNIPRQQQLKAAQLLLQQLNGEAVSSASQQEVDIPKMEAKHWLTLLSALIVAAAGALGDSGSPASENTLVCTSVFNADGKHDHIRDTCIPSFLCVNIPIVIICTLAACVM